MTRLPAPVALAATLILAIPAPASPQPAPLRDTEKVPAAAVLTGTAYSDLRDAVERYGADRAALLRRYDLPWSATRRDRLREYYTGWQARLAEVPFNTLGAEGRIDYLQLRNDLAYQLALLDRERRMAAEMTRLLPFADAIIALQEARRDLRPVEPPAAAQALALIAADIDRAQRLAGDSAQRLARTDTERIVIFRTVSALNDLKQTMQRWYRFYSGYDPLFTWWAAEPYRRADTAIDAYVKTLRERVLGIRPGDEDPIVGDPIGAEGLDADLAREMIAYSPADLVRIAERELAWCEAEMLRAAHDMGFGSDWKAALEQVKQKYVEPGRQTELTRTLAEEAIRFIEERDLVTVPPLAKEIWRMEMLSPEQQRTAPFYLGGEVIQVAFPTDAMTHEDKLMAMRGNNVHFSRAVVHHELIPGHHLQGYMTARYHPHRRAFGTPFWTEGWALYWEMLLWDLGFPQTPEDRIGMLFWRMHRAARIIFSLNAHLGRMTPQQAIDFLVDRVGHERANATAEVRRSLNGTYPPLYQAAYMLGGLQFRALHRELVGSGRMTDRDFHDAILQGGPMPVELVRVRLLGLPVGADYRAQWRFAE